MGVFQTFVHINIVCIFVSKGVGQCLVTSSVSIDISNGNTFQDADTEHTIKKKGTMKKPDEKSDHKVIVTGDVTMDWHIVRSDPQKTVVVDWDPARWATVRCQRGGAALLADLVERVAERLATNTGSVHILFQTGAPNKAVLSNDPDFHHNYALWGNFTAGNNRAFRVAEHLGLDQRKNPDESEWQRVAGDPDKADLVVLDDANLGFREMPGIWPQALKNKGPSPWIVLKMAGPLARGGLWNHLLAEHSEKLIVVTTIDDLRRSEVQISQGLSWERTAQDVVWELTHNPRVNGMSRCFATIVSFNTEGAILITNEHIGKRAGKKSAKLSAQLFFDPQCMEGEWQQQYPGSMIGYTSCMVAGIVREILKSQNAEDIESGILKSLAAIRCLHDEGYHVVSDGHDKESAFPFDQITRVLNENKSPFAAVNIQDPVRFLDQQACTGSLARGDGCWTILQDRYRDNLVHVAKQIVYQGSEAALKDVPQGRFGKLLTVDRREIESFRCIHSLMGEYIRKGRQKRPLSVAVFGAPGSGKSFGITQVAKSLSPDMIKDIEFNLSQFGSPDELSAAFHMVRDISLSGKIPLVFWDEFDTSLNGRQLGWLPYFLSPMQDGKFREGQLTHPIGSAIFVFAGGTCERMTCFGENMTPEVYRTSKVPDFVSRLKGYVNILGPNRQTYPAEDPKTGDPYHIIRRAILLRSLLQINAPFIFEKRDGIKYADIDKGVLRAFLEVSTFKHGIRSMESIIAMSQLAGKRSYARSSLPAETQLNLHADGQEFLSLVQTMELDGKLLEKLAELHHNMFCKDLLEKKYTTGQVTDEKQKIHSSLKPFEQLSDDEKEQNRLAVRDIPAKLASVGYAMIPARSNELPFEFPEDKQDLERLAELEHERWLQVKLDAGWRYEERTDKDRKVHEAMLPWAELSESQKEKDRALIRCIPKILAGAGYTVVKLHDR